MVSLGAVAIASASGGLTAAVALVGRTAPTSASLPWIGVLCGGTLLFVLWALLFSLLLAKGPRLSIDRALKHGAICLLPLFL
ncbi:MAG TPA: hypothetical protein VHS28_06000, partial [Chloroflexota bacterium]|nr:hypothetical protein [Chloroflexota bacterium]